jgi:hypothetical protein
VLAVTAVDLDPHEVEASVTTSRMKVANRRAGKLAVAETIRTASPNLLLARKPGRRNI